MLMDAIGAALLALRPVVPRAGLHTELVGEALVHHRAGVSTAARGELERHVEGAITDKVMDGMAEWQNRPLDRVYPVLFVDAINVKIRDGQVANRPVYVVMAVTVDGTRDILGIWAGDGGEGAKYWLHVFTELKNRGQDDVLMLVCDGLKGLPEAVETVRPRTIVQTCVVPCCGTASATRPVRIGTRSPRPSSPSTPHPARTPPQSGSWSSRSPRAGSIRRS
ncbi:hypothetical protein STPH1_1574 [Streptomyces sp. OM5714]|nr:hypothetical protein STPH1_1574 [Streptomyces sp. OM5714]